MSSSIVVAATATAAATTTRSTRTKRRCDFNNDIVSSSPDKKMKKSTMTSSSSSAATTTTTDTCTTSMSMSIPNDCCSLGLQRIIKINNNTTTTQKQKQATKLGPLILLYKNMYLGRTPFKMMQKMKSMNDNSVDQWTYEELQKFHNLNKNKFSKTQAPLGINWEGGSKQATRNNNEGSGLLLNNKTNNNGSIKSKGGISTEEHVSRHLLQIIDHCSTSIFPSNNATTNNDNDPTTKIFTLTLQRCSEDLALKKQKKGQQPNNATKRMPDVKIISTVNNNDDSNNACTSSMSTCTKNIGPDQQVIVKEGDELLILKQQYRYKFVRVHTHTHTHSPLPQHHHHHVATEGAVAVAVAATTTVTNTTQKKTKTQAEMMMKQKNNDDKNNSTPIDQSTVTSSSVGSTNCSTRSSRKSSVSSSSVNDQTVIAMTPTTPMDDVDENIDENDDNNGSNDDNDSGSDNSNEKNMIEKTIITTKEEEEEKEEEEKTTIISDEKVANNAIASANSVTSTSTIQGQLQVQRQRPAFLSFWDHSSRRSKSVIAIANNNSDTDDSKRIISPDATATTTTTTTTTIGKNVVTAAPTTYTYNDNDDLNDIDIEELQPQSQIQLPSSRDMPISLANMYWKALNSSRPREGAWYLNTMINPLVNNTIPSISICIEWMKLLTWGPQTSNGTAIVTNKTNSNNNNNNNNRRGSSSSSSTATTSSSKFFWDGPRLYHAMSVWKKALGLHPTMLLPRMIDSAPGGPTEWWKTVLCFDDIMDENELVDKRDNVHHKDNYLYSLPAAATATAACDGDDSNDDGDVEFETAIEVLRMRSCRLDALIYLLESNIAFEERSNKEQQQHEETLKEVSAAVITTDEEEEKNEDGKVDEKLAQSDSDSDSDDEVKKDETKKNSSSLSTSSSRYSRLTLLREIRIFGAKAALRVVAQAMARLWVSQRYYLGYYDDDVTDEDMKKRASSVTINSLLGSNRYSLWQERTEVVEELVSQLAQMLRLIRTIVANNNKEEALSLSSTSNNGGIRIRRSRRHVESSSDLTERDLKGILWNAMDMQIQKSIPKTKRKKKVLKRATKDDDKEEEMGPKEQLLVDWLYSLRPSLGEDFVKDLSEHVGVSEEYGDMMEM